MLLFAHEMPYLRAGLGNVRATSPRQKAPSCPQTGDSRIPASAAATLIMAILFSIPYLYGLYDCLFLQRPSSHLFSWVQFRNVPRTPFPAPQKDITMCLHAYALWPILFFAWAFVFKLLMVGIVALCIPFISCAAY